MKQDIALKILKLGYHVYLGGSAGTGKTHVLNQYIEHLKEEMIGVGVTASTGIAATHLGGVTIHSWAGFGIKEKLTGDDLKNIRKKHYLRQRIKKAEVLIIDEISMLSGHQLDMVDQICREFRKNDMPFGDMQVVLSGDFFQLPPILKNGETPSFAYESQVWQRMNIKICYLSEPFRQQDPAFLQILNEIRSNQVTDESLELLEQRMHRPVQNKITKLYTHNADIDAINTGELQKLRGKERVFHMSSSGPVALVEALHRSCLAPGELALKKGAFVMFVRNNFEQGFINSDAAFVLGFAVGEDGSVDF